MTNSNQATQRLRRRGNALMEYVVPAGVILLGAGVLATVLDANNLMGEYFMSASGHTKANMSGTTLQTKGLAENSYGDTSDGMENFKYDHMLKVTDGSGVDTGDSGGGFFSLDIPNRSGSRPMPSTTESLFGPSETAGR